MAAVSAVDDTVKDRPGLTPRLAEREDGLAELQEGVVQHRRRLEHAVDT